MFTIVPPRGSDRAIAVDSITGAFLDPARPDGHKRRVLRNMTTTRLRDVTVRQASAQPLQIPYDFYSEFKPQALEVEFRANVVDQSDSAKYNVLLYRGTVTVEEPAQSWLDVQLWSVYVIVLGIFGGIAYAAYRTYAVPILHSRTPKRSAKAQPVSAPTYKNGKTYDEDWIVRISYSR